MKLRMPARFRRMLLLIVTFVAFSLPQTALAHDMNKGKIDVTLTAFVTGANEATFTAEAIPGIAAPQLILSWKLLDGGELLDGPAESAWANLPVHAPMTQSRRARVPGEGVYRVGVTAILPFDQENRFIDSAVLFMIVDGNGTVEIAKKDPNAVSPMGSIMIDETPVLASQEVLPAEITSPNADPCFTVRGVFPSH